MRSAESAGTGNLHNLALTGNIPGAAGGTRTPKTVGTLTGRKTRPASMANPYRIMSWERVAIVVNGIPDPGKGTLIVIRDGRRITAGPATEAEREGSKAKVKRTLASGTPGRVRTSRGHRNRIQRSYGNRRRDS